MRLDSLWSRGRKERLEEGKVEVSSAFFPPSLFCHGASLPSLSRSPGSPPPHSLRAIISILEQKHTGFRYPAKRHPSAATLPLRSRRTTPSTFPLLSPPSFSPNAHEPSQDRLSTSIHLPPRDSPNPQLSNHVYPFPVDLSSSRQSRQPILDLLPPSYDLCLLLSQPGEARVGNQGGGTFEVLGVWEWDHPGS